MLESSRSDRTYSLVAAFLFGAFCILTLYPFIYAVSYSLSNGVKALTRNVTLLPVDFTLENYRIVFANPRILRAFCISIARTCVGTLVFLGVTGLAAYSLSKRYLLWRKRILTLLIVPMYIGGGLLPYYVLIHNLGLMDRFLVYILPAAFSPFFMLIMKVYYEAIPESIEESASIDGAGFFTIYVKMILPLSLPVFATVALFVSVGQWNSWFDALLFVTNSNLHPLQLILQNVLKEAEVTSYQQVFEISVRKARTVSTETLRMAILVITILPIVLAYPFFQRYLIRGITLGAVKQ